MKITLSPSPPDGAILKSKSELVGAPAGVLVAAAALLDRVPSWAGQSGGSRSPMEAGNQQTTLCRESGAAVFWQLLWEAQSKRNCFNRN